MKHFHTRAFAIFFLLNIMAGSSQNSFYKNCLVASITRGPSTALIISKANDGYKHSEVLSGSIDPFIAEYGLTDKIGVGFSIGGENYMMDINNFYQAKASQQDQVMMMSTKYYTQDVSYHFVRSKRMDVSGFSGIGYYTVSGSVYSGPYFYSGMQKYFSYTGHGAVLRSGIRTRYYFSKHFGLMAMLYGFEGITRGTPRMDVPAIPDGKPVQAYTTSLRGFGMEFGVCMRLFKQKNKTDESVANSEEEEEKEPMIRFSWD